MRWWWSYNRSLVHVVRTILILPLPLHLVIHQDLHKRDRGEKEEVLFFPTSFFSRGLLRALAHKTEKRKNCSLAPRSFFAGKASIIIIIKAPHNHQRTKSKGKPAHTEQAYGGKREGRGQNTPLASFPLASFEEGGRDVLPHIFCHAS